MGGNDAQPHGPLPGGGDHGHWRNSCLRIWERGQPLIQFRCKSGWYRREIHRTHIDPIVAIDAISIPGTVDKVRLYHDRYKV